MEVKNMKITSENFEKEVLNSEVPVLVDFFATWCGPCKMMSPVVEELAKEMEGKAKVYKVDTDEEQNLAIKYGIMSIPTFIVFKNGEPVGKAIGMRDKQELINLLNK
ncbi:MAG: thioredoxin [Clostridia bacterium]|nr:thioredoxin [Clostridia bacterium]